jgi:hypothetical protein
MDILRRFWERWKRFGQFMGDFIGRLVLTIFYFTIFLPFGLGIRLLGDKLDIKRRIKPDWQQRATEDLTIEDSRRLA